MADWGSKEHLISLLQNCKEELKGSKEGNDMNKEMLIVLVDQDPLYTLVKISATETRGSISSCSATADPTRLQQTVPNSGHNGLG